MTEATVVSTKVISQFFQHVPGFSFDRIYERKEELYILVPESRGCITAFVIVFLHIFLRIVTYEMNTVRNVV